MSERIQKVLANAGVASRREIERWIVAGRITIDGRPAQLGDQIDGGEDIAVDGRPVELERQQAIPRHTTIAYYKPAGEITTKRDPERRKSVFDSLPRPPQGRWVNVGRLDLSTSGLLLLTTDGELAHRLMHPSYEISREYAVRLIGTPTDSQLDRLTAGVELEDGPAHFEAVRQGGGQGRNVWYHVRLREGRNREVRRLFEAIGLTVSRLIRVRYGPVELGNLRRGQTRPLRREEVEALYEAVKLRPPRR